MNAPVKESIMTIPDLLWANEHNFEMAQHYLGQVTVLEDLALYLKYLHDKEVETETTSILQRQKRRPKGIHPSSACKKGVCLKKIYYECTFEIEPNRGYDQQMQLTWDIGTILHDLHQLWFKDMYEDQFEFEVPLKSGLINSRTDGIFSFSHLRIVLEAKSIKEGGSFGFDTVQHVPMEDHVRQAHFYMKLADVPFALIFYIAKNTSEYAEHAVAFNPLIWEEMERDVIIPVTNAVNGGEDVPFSPGWHCRWCDFEHSCSKGGVDDSSW
jgi:hypothetical protein